MTKGKAFMLLALLVLTAAAQPSAAWAGRKPQVSLSLIMDNGLVELKQPLLLERGRILISTADLVALFAADCERQGENGIMLKTDSVHLTLQVGKDLAVVTRGEILEIAGLDVPPRLVQNVLYLPLRFTAEHFGAAVAWDKECGCVLLDSGSGTAVEGIDVEYSLVSREDLQANSELSAWYEKHHRTEGLYSLTLHEDTYILLCAGAKPTGGYRVKIEKAVETSPNNLVITATLTKPGPQDMVTMAITYPNALLRFSGRRFNTANSSLVK